jgi:hypothetical protein
MLRTAITGATAYSYWSSCIRSRGLLGTLLCTVVVMLGNITEVIGLLGPTIRALVTLLRRDNYAVPYKL